MENVLRYLIKKQIWVENLPEEQDRWYSTRELQSMIFDYPEMVDASLIEDNFYQLAEIVVDVVNEKIEERDAVNEKIEERDGE